MQKLYQKKIEVFAEKTHMVAVKGTFELATTITQSITIIKPLGVNLNKMYLIYTAAGLGIVVVRGVLKKKKQADVRKENSFHSQYEGYFGEGNS